MAYNNEVLVYNSHGKEYEVPRVRASSIYELQRGDHIAFHRLRGALWHHAIVEDVDTEWGEIHVIEYTNTLKGFIKDNCIPPKSPGIAKVVRNKLEFQETTVYLMIHEECFDPETVVCRAQSKVGEGKYSPITNNCEHFAMWCKTGRSSSDQVEKAKGMFGKQAVEQTTSQAASHILKPALLRVAQQALRVSVSSAGQMASSAGTRFGGCLASTAVGGVLAAGVEGLSIIYDIRCAYRNWQAGKISKEQFKIIAGKRYVSGNLSAGGSTFGATMGLLFIPVPIVGPVVGGVVGGLTGSFIGNIVGNKLFD